MRKIKYFFGAMVLAAVLTANPALALVAPSPDPAPIPPPPPNDRQALYRLYNPVINDHFYTANQDEANAVTTSHGYIMEGGIGYVSRYQLDGTVKMYRMWNPHINKHFYTTSYDEMTHAPTLGYIYEGVTGWIAANCSNVNDLVCHGGKALYRLYNPGLNKHFYTVDATERDYVITHLGYVSEDQLGWLLDGILYPQ